MTKGVRVDGSRHRGCFDRGLAGHDWLTPPEPGDTLLAFYAG